MLYSKCAKTIKSVKPYNQIQNTCNTIVFAVYKFFEVSIDSVVGIEYI